MKSKAKKEPLEIPFIVSPADCIRENLTTVYGIRMQLSKHYSELRQHQAEMGLQVQEFITRDVFIALDEALTNLLKEIERYWWARGLESGVKNETTIEMRNIVFNLPSTPMIDDASKGLKKLISSIKKDKSYQERQIIHQYRALCIEDCRMVAPYAYLSGFEWGRKMMEYAGAKNNIIAWNTLYKILPFR